MPGLSTFKALVMGSLAASAIAAPMSPKVESSLFKRFDQCVEGDVYKPGKGFGNQANGFGSCVSRWGQGQLPKRIRAKSDKDMLRWFEVTYTDDKVEGFGTDIDNLEYSGRVDWNPFVDHFDELSISGQAWGGQSVGRVVAKLSNGQEMDSGAWDMGNIEDVYRGSKGDGMLLGFKINRGDGIDYLEPMFSKSKLRSVTLINPKVTPSLDDLNAVKDEDKKIEVIQTGHDMDNTDVSTDGTLKLTNWLQATEQTTITHAKEKGSDISHQFSLEVSGKIEMNIPTPKKVGGAEIGGSLGYSYTDTRIEREMNSEATTTGKAVNVQYAIDQTVKAGQHVTCVTTVLQSSNELTLEGDLVWEFEDGTKHVFPITADLLSKEHSQAFTKCQDVLPNKFDNEGRPMPPVQRIAQDGSRVGEPVPVTDEGTPEQPVEQPREGDNKVQ